MSRARVGALMAGVLGWITACAKDRPRPLDLANALVSTPESGSPGAVTQRYRFRRQLLDSMRADLVRLVAAESLYFADSGKYSSTTSCPGEPGAVHWCAASGDNLTFFPRMTAHGWSASITNLNLSVFCEVQVGNDTSFGVPSGQPTCVPAHPGSPRAF